MSRESNTQGTGGAGTGSGGGSSSGAGTGTGSGGAGSGSGRRSAAIGLLLGVVVVGLVLMVTPLVDVWADVDHRAAAYPLAATAAYAVTALVVGSRRRRT